MDDNLEEGPSNSLELLGVTLKEQDSLEREMAQKVDLAMISKEDELDNKRLQKSLDKLQKVKGRLQILQSKLSNPLTRISERQSLKKDVEWLTENEIKPLEKDIKEIKERLSERTASVNAASSSNNNQSSLVTQLPSESRQEFLIRTGKITAFGTSNGFEQEDATNLSASNGVQNHQQLKMPGIVDLEESDGDLNWNSDEEEEEISDLYSDADIEVGESRKRERKSTKKEDEERNIDDGDEDFYQNRLAKWISKRSELRKKFQPDLPDDLSIPEWLKPHPSVPDAVLNSEFKIPGDIYPSLFDYQKTCVQWLWELYQQKTGGIIGDEMGLGKTIQVISFIAGLHYSGKLDKPVLIVCPATVLRQWCNEFHKWWPPLRTVILHSIGSGMDNSTSVSKKEEDLDKMFEEDDFDDDEVTMSANAVKSHARAKKVVNTVVTKGHVLITTYVGLRIYAKELLSQKWGYAVLDEGHKIRNPDSAISLTCKQLKTSNRIILSGTPIQNNLIELWSLFDFIFPGRLGTLPVFQLQFSIPINIGGYANATNVQVQTGYKCAVVLRDLISPYLLRRVKADVAKDLPQKNEMVLFCKLTKFQMTLYEKFLSSEEMTSVLNGKRHVLFGVDFLRKLCNHPDLVQPQTKKNPTYGDYKKSGKMQVVKALIELWKNEGHKILLFTQTKQMLDILEKFVNTLNETQEGVPFKYLRMDGTTPIKVRQSLVDTFNEDPSYNIFLLTTRVGGLGVNLTGANRVIIYDPDWNPSTDVQARERAWRLGQKKDVTIYRLMIAGSIEEKIYHRQIFKQFLVNKILKDPKQRRFFKMNDLHDLFTLGDPSEKGTETGDMFNGTEINYEGSKSRLSKMLNKRRKTDQDEGEDDFEKVAQINGVSALEQFQGDKKEKNNESDRLLDGLFANSGVHSALQHDSIMDSSRPDTILIDREASKIAEEAARKLRESRKLVRRARIGTPTFTGRFGSAGRSSGISSSSILNNIRAKKEAKSTSTTPRTMSPIPSSVTPEPESSTEFQESQVISKIRDFVSLNGGSATSAQVVSNIELPLDSHKNIQVIRSMLRSICDWHNESKLWTLKEDFKDL